MDFYSLGQQLKEAREAKELTLQQAEAALKIRSSILNSFEQGEFTLTDASPVQIRGFIRNYARYLALDENLILQYYDSAAESLNRRRDRASKRSSKRERDERTANRTPANRTAANNKPPTSPTRSATATGEHYGVRVNERRTSFSQRLMNFLLIIVLGGAALAVITFVTLQLVQNNDEMVDNPEANTSGGIIGQRPPTLTSTPRVIVPSPTATLIDRTPQNYTGQAILVTIEFRQRTWLDFTADGNLIYAGIVRPNEIVLEYEANTEIIVHASNAAALVVTYNGQSQASFGARGQRVDITFRPNDQIEVRTGPGFDTGTDEFTATPPDTPTAIAGTLLAELTPSSTPGPSPTPSDTSTPSDTPEASATPTDTPTATDTATITPTPSDTLTPSVTRTETLTPTITLTPSETAIVPLRITPTPAQAEKP